MKKVLKWIGVVLGLLVGLVVLTVGVVYAITEARLNIGDDGASSVAAQVDFLEGKQVRGACHNELVF